MVGKRESCTSFTCLLSHMSRALNFKLLPCDRSMRLLRVIPSCGSTWPQALAYKQRILDAVPHGGSHTFEPLMTLYLTDNTTPDDVAAAKVWRWGCPSAPQQTHTLA
eukprot:358487-Chlamydomonas_euryale.AAC.17